MVKLKKEKNVINRHIDRGAFLRFEEYYEEAG